MTMEQTQSRKARSGGIKVPSADKTAFYAAVFMMGGMVAALGVEPFPTLIAHGKTTVAAIGDLTRGRPEILQPHVYDGQGVVALDRDRAQPGLTLVQGLMPGGAQVRMVDIDGNEVHRWDIDFFKAFPNPDHIIPVVNVPKSPHHYHTQGFWPMPDGSLLANIGDVGTVMLDQCSNPLWTIDRMTHHSINRTEDGKFWIPAHISIYETPDALLPRDLDREQILALLAGAGKNYNNSVLLVSAEGEIEKEFSVLQAVADAGLEHALYGSLQEIPADPTHLNDIEVVNAALAAKIEGVNEGDLLVSLRDMHMLAILDQQDGHLKWHKEGPWLRQHDPDILDDGTIEIFNNRARVLNAGIRNSQIMSYDAATDAATVLHPVGAEDAFYSQIMGAQERLENGNILITETLAGRVFEATPRGHVVWDYRVPYDAEVTSLVEVSTRVPMDYFNVNNWNCEEK